jgi:hypothetical protein
VKELDNKHWEAAEKLLSACTGNLDISIGIKAVKEAWLNNKGWMLPYFDEDGRHCINNIMPDREDLLNSAFYEGQKIAAALAIKNKYYKVMGQNNGYNAVMFLKKFYGIVGVEDFCNNKLSSKRPYPDKPGKSVPTGTKVSKYLYLYISAEEHNNEWNGAYLKGYGKENLEIVYAFMVDVYSQMLAMMQTAGDKVVMSVNPMDMLLISAHNTGWHSCHQPFNGDWRTGLVAMLMGNIEAVCYVSRSIDTIHEGKEIGLDMKWDRKIWRWMVYFDKDHRSCFFGDQFGGKQPSFAHAAQQMASEVLAMYAGVAPDCKCAPFNKYYGASEPGDEHDDFRMSYSRTNWESCDGPTRALRLTNGGTYPKGLVGGQSKIPCLVCGELRSRALAYNNETKVYACQKCYNINFCNNCGKSLKPDETKHKDNNAYCQSCYEKMYKTCPDCGKETGYYSFQKVYYDRGLTKNVCFDCATTKYERCRDCGDYYSPNLVNVLKRGSSICYKCQRYHNPSVFTEEAEIIKG